MPRFPAAPLLTFLPLLLLGACQRGGGGGDPGEPAFSAATLATDIRHPELNWVPGTTFTYVGNTDEGREKVVVQVSHLTRAVLGVECTEVVDRAYVDGELVEETFDWYAEDAKGNVWYMGEDATEYESGVEVSKGGSWEAGVGGAQAGILMKAKPIVGDSYRQEFLPGVAEDMTKCVRIAAPVTISGGMQYVTTQFEEWNPLDPGAGRECKNYAAGVGMVREMDTDGSNRLHLKRLDVDTLPVIDPADFTSVVDHPYLPLPAGMGLAFEGTTSEGDERFELRVSGATRVVMGVTCIEVEDRGYVDGVLREVALDWYAQDGAGNVWYFGEDVSNYDENGVFEDQDGSWEAGVGGAVPGIMMLALPRVGDSYRQEYWAGQAEDKAAVRDTTVTETVPVGTFTDCIRTLDWNPLDPASAREHKVYAPGVGLIRESLEDGSERVELIGNV